MNFRSYLTFLGRNKAYTCINVFGLSVSLMFVILIGVYVQQEYSMDRSEPRADRILVMGVESSGKNHMTGSHWRVQRLLQKRYPEIETSCAVHIHPMLVEMQNGEKVSRDILFTDSTFFRVFGCELLQGDPARVLDGKDDLVLEEQTARLYFGDANPVGRTMTVGDSLHFKVTGVFRRMENTHLHKFDMIARFEHTEVFNDYLTNEYMGNAVGSDVYLLLKPGTDVEGFVAGKEGDITRYFKTFFWMFQMEGSDAAVKLIQLKDLYFSDYGSANGHSTRGNRRLVNILFAVGVLILLFAMMNYVNLTTAQAGYRSKEMATRRLLGSQRIDIVWRLIAESVLLCLLSLAVAVALAWWAAPYAGRLLETEIDLSRLLAPADLLLMAVLTVTVGVLAGVLPAVVLSRAKPIDIVRGTFRRQTRMVFSKVFITFQNVITIVLIACSLTMLLQTRHLIEAPLGFNRENIIEVGNPSSDSTVVETFMNEVRRLPCVTLVSRTMGTPGGHMNNSTFEMNHKMVSTWVLVGDEDYLAMYGIQVEREYPGARGSYVTRAYLEECGLRDTVRSIYVPQWGSREPIRGIVKPFRLQTITDERRAIEVRITRDKFIPWYYAIKVQGDPVEAYREVQRVYKKVFRLDCNEETPFVDQMIASRFSQERQASAIILLFAGVAVLVSLLGLVAMSTYFIQQRRREIAVRKVFGSTGRQIWTGLVRTFMAYVLVAFVIAVPVVWHFMSDWLAGYSYRIALSWWIYAVAGLFSLVVSFVAVFIQSYAAANENPVKHIKDNG